MFLTHPAIKRKASGSTQNQALNAIVFLYKQILAKDPGQCNAIWAKRGKRLPVILSLAEEFATPPPARVDYPERPAAATVTFS